VVGCPTGLGDPYWTSKRRKVAGRAGTRETRQLLREGELFSDYGILMGPFRVRLVWLTVGLLVGGIVAPVGTTPQPEVRVVTVEVDRPEPEWEDTPILDGLVDWVEQDRQDECLWRFLQASGVELTLETVMAAGVWTDALGGACRVIGEDDEDVEG
jgi:hypothetical protein